MLNNYSSIGSYAADSMAGLILSSVRLAEREEAPRPWMRGASSLPHILLIVHLLGRFCDLEDLHGELDI
jgi:hypothetical protein